MIGYLRGKLLHKDEDQILLDCNGVGYEVSVHDGMGPLLPGPGEELALFTHLLTREDGTWLFGFADQAEKELFLALIKISGVGPRTAQAIIATYTANDLALIVETGDGKALSRISGIGPKTAERLLLELRTPLKRLGKLQVSRTLKVTATTGTVPGGAAGDSEAALALEALGFRRSEVEPVLARLRREGIKGNTAELVKEALRRLKS